MRRWNAVLALLSLGALACGDAAPATGAPASSARAADTAAPSAPLASLAPLAPGTPGTPGAQADPKPVRPRPNREALLRATEARERIEARLAAMERYLDEPRYLTALDRVVADVAQTDEPEWVRIEDGWFFTRSLESFLSWNRPAPTRALPLAIDFELETHPLHAIVDLNRQLHEHDIDFLVVPLTERVHLFPELLLGTEPIADFVGWDPGVARFMIELGLNGVEVVDLTPLFAAHRDFALDDNSTDVCLDLNRHWSSHAAELAAEELARRIRRLPWASELGPHREGVDFRVVEQPIEWVPAEQIAPGTPDTVVLDATVVEMLPGGTGPRARGPGAPIQVLGDSFAHIFFDNGAGLVNHLYRHTGHLIDPIWPARGGASIARKSLARRRDNLEGKKLVIWIFCVEALTYTGEWSKSSFFDDAPRKRDG
jgi:hypothetical protein